MTIERYTDYLDGDYSANHWSEEGVDNAADLVSEFEDADWQALKAAVPGKPAAWAVRCAETLSNVDDSRALEVLALLLESPEDDVKLQALDGINSLMSMGVGVGDHANAFRAALESQRSRTPGAFYARLFDALSQKLA